MSDVSWSQDLDRIVKLTRRQISDDEKEQIRVLMTRRLRRPDQPITCTCVSRWGFCIAALRTAQAWALAEISIHGGILGPIGISHGKTGIDILAAMAAPACARALALVPAQLKAQFAQDFEQWSVHFRTPNLAGGRSFTQGRPVLHVMSYSEVSLPKHTDTLAKLDPDLIILDEGHNIRNASAARTKRVQRVWKGKRVVVLSATMTSNSVRDYAHLSEAALGVGSPLPLNYMALEQWADALDPEPKAAFRPGAGALRALMDPAHPEEDVRSAFCRRLVDTPGVVATEDSALDIPLLMSERPITVPPDVRKLIDEVYRKGERPDGELLVEAMEVSRVARQVASGFYYWWHWDPRYPEEVCREWIAARKEWHAELRERLSGAPGMDSPFLLEQAAERALVSYAGPLPVWHSATFERWRNIRSQAKPETRTTWVNDYLIKDAADWANTTIGIVWYEFSALGRRIAEAAKLPQYGGGPAASEGLLTEQGQHSIIASIKAHGTGKNLQAFHRNLITTCPASGSTWEQLLGRTHRFGQRHPDVSAELYWNTDRELESFLRAELRARYIGETLPARQKLQDATWSPALRAKLDAQRR